MMDEQMSKQETDKTKDELVRELEELRRQISKMEAPGNQNNIPEEPLLRQLVEEEMKVYRGNGKGLDTVDKQLKHEVEERIRAEVSLLRTEEMYRVLVENADDVITLSDLNFNILFCNRAYYFSLGYEDENIDLEDFDRVHPDDVTVIKESRKLLFKAGKVEFEYRIKHKDDHWIHRYAKSIIIYGNDLRQGSILSIIRDVTRYKRAEEQARLHQEQLIQADKMVSLGTLVSGVAHEINNPNNFVMLNVPMLQKTWESTLPILDEHYKKKGDFYVGERLKYSKMRESIPVLLSGILEGTKRIKSIVEQLKNFSRMETFESTRPVDIGKVIKTAVDLISNLIKKSTNHFSIDYGKNIPQLRGNFQRLEQVIINLIENSCQALPNEDKAIHVSALYDKDANIITVKVKDEGIGMNSDTLSKILDPFFTTKRHSKGTGLGLSVSSNIIKNHDGFLNFESIPGKGTTATIILPVKREEK
jgi:PAS domain S-box-containing protein